MPYLFNFSQVGGFPIASGNHIDQDDECPHNKGNGEYIVLIKSGEESHEIYLHSEDHVNFCVSCVSWEGTDTELNDAN